MFKKKTLTFEEVKFNEDVRVQLVKHSGDYKVDIAKRDPRNREKI